MLTNVHPEFRYFQQLHLIIASLKMYEEFMESVVNKYDKFRVEYDETVDEFIIMHDSVTFNCTRPICYVPNKNFKMKDFHGFFFHCLNEAWIEYLV